MVNLNIIIGFIISIAKPDKQGFLDSTSTLRGVSRTLHQCFLDQVYDSKYALRAVSKKQSIDVVSF